MNITFTIVAGMLVLSILAPFISLYAVSLIKKKEYSTHMRIQKWLFWVCVVGVLLLEVQIRVSGGSGSLVVNSSYAGSALFKYILIAHIIGAVLTYIIWGITVFWSNKKFKTSVVLPGSFSKLHRRLGYISIIGLFYIAISALAVFNMAFIL
ncbi:MAG: DUF420 domain-containing protein [Balneolaceae bacterium]